MQMLHFDQDDQIPTARNGKGVFKPDQNHSAMKIFFFIFTKKTLGRRQEMKKSCKPLFPLPISQIDLCSPYGVLTQLSEIINPNLKAMIELFVPKLLQKTFFSHTKQI